jgi:hypothetical protein
MMRVIGILIPTFMSSIIFSNLHYTRDITYKGQAYDKGGDNSEYLHFFNYLRDNESCFKSDDEEAGVMLPNKKPHGFSDSM